MNVANPTGAALKQDIGILRDLASRVAEYAHKPIQAERANLWRRLNGLERVRPLISWHMEELCWPEALPAGSFLVQSAELKDYEQYLRRVLWHAEHVNDDRIIPAEIPYRTVICDSGNGLSIATHERTEQASGSITYVHDLEKEADIEKIHDPIVTVDLEATERNRVLCSEIFDGILTPVTLKRNGWEFPSITLVDNMVCYRGMEQFFMDLVDRPEWVHAVMERLLHAEMSRLDQYERLNLLGLNNSYNEVGTSAMGYTDELPAPDFDGVHVRAKDLWGWSCAQSFVSVGSDMHEEFSLQYERRYLERFGLNAIACCEPIDKKFDRIRTVPRLRLISISEWNDRRAASELLGQDYVFAFKPTGSYFAADKWDLDVARRDMEDLFSKTRKNVLVIHHNACSTCRGDLRRIFEWVDLVRELAERNA